MKKISTYIRTISVYHAPTHYDYISDYKFLYVKNDTYFIVKYNYYNQFAEFSTLVIPHSFLDELELYEKENESLYVKRVEIKDSYKGILNNLSDDARNEIEKELKCHQRDEKSIKLLLYAYELSGKSLI